MNLNIPLKLDKGDSIGIVAPASPFKKELFLKGLDLLDSWGMNVKYSENLFEKEGYLAGSDKHRAGLLNSFFADKKIKAIICARGGFGSIRLLHYIDFDLIKNNPKIFIGFSDISVLLNVFYLKCGFVTFHGPVLTSLVNSDEQTKDSFKGILNFYEQFEMLPVDPFTIRPGKAKAPLIGGNLTSLCHLLGTNFQINFDNHILFLEDVGEDLYRIDRMLTQMRLAGCFDNISGLFLGSFEGCGDIYKIYDLFDFILQGIDIPILAGFDIGHGKKNISIPIGGMTLLDSYKQKIFINESGSIVL